MSIPKDPTATTTPEDVEAHMAYRRIVEEEQEHGEDVEAHMPYRRG